MGVSQENETMVFNQSVLGGVVDFNSIASIVGAVTGSQVLVTWLQNRSNKKKVDADAAQILLDKTLEWASRLSSRIDKLETENTYKDKLIAELYAKIAHLETQVCSHS